MPKKVLLVALALLAAVPAVARADASDVTRGVVGFGTVHVDGAADCTSPAGTPDSTQVDCAVLRSTDVDSCSSDDFGTTCTVTLTAQTASGGWRFDHWSGTGCSGTAATCTFTNAQEFCNPEVGSCSGLILIGPWHPVAHFADTHAPATTFTQAPADNTVAYGDTQAQRFAWTTDEDAEGPTFGCRQAQAGPFAACASGIMVGSLADGIHDFCVQASDPSGLTGGAVCRHWEQERNPTARVVTGPPATTASADASFTYDSNKTGHAADGSTLAFQCSVDGAAFAPCPVAGRTVAGVGEGRHTFAVQAVFRGALEGPPGHTSPPATSTWVRDLTPPTPAITGGPAPGLITNDPSATFTFVSSEPSAFRCALDGGAPAPCASPFTLRVPDGAHTFKVFASDLAGNANPTPASRTWIVTADADHDGFVVPADCNDHDARIHPGATDVPGNRVDENCDGRDAPFPKVGASVAASWRFFGRVTKVVGLTAQNVPAGATVTLRCGRCHVAKTIKVRKAVRKLRLARSFKGRRLLPGTKIELRVVKPATIGLDVVFTTRSGNLPKQRQRRLPPR
jgi:Putative metal-binding motif